MSRPGPCLAKTKLGYEPHVPSIWLREDPIVRDVAISLLREWHVGLKSPKNIMQQLISPVMYLLIFAPTMARNVGVISWEGRLIPYLSFVIPGIAAMSAVSVGNAIGITTYVDRLTGELETLFSLPIRRVAILAGYIANAVFRSVVAGLAFLLLAQLIPGGLLIMTLGSTVMASLVLAVSATGWVLLAVTLSLSIGSQTTYNLVYNMIELPLVFTASVFYNPENGSALARWLGPINPLAFSANLLRALCQGAPPRVNDVLGLFAFVVAVIVSSLWAINRALR